MKFGSIALLLCSAAQAFGPHLVPLVKVQRSSVILWDFLGENIYDECIDIFSDGISLDPQCYPSPTSTALFHRQGKVNDVEMSTKEDDCEFPYYDGSGDVLCWVG